MNYIGSKHKLSGFIQDTVMSVCGSDLSKNVFCDLFAGTGAVGRAFKPLVKSVIANDLEYYSYVLNRAYLKDEVSNITRKLISTLNSLEGHSGFIAKEYGEAGASDRLYFSNENARKIDSIRTTLSDWKSKNTISEPDFYILLASLLEAADKVANTASVYGAFLKKLKTTAQKPIILTLDKQYTSQKNGNNKDSIIYNQDSNELIHKIEGDILYLDPPYNARQYGANYHLLNTIAKYNIFVPQGKTGLPSYNKSDYCSKLKVTESLEELIKNARFKYIFLSYNNEGLMSSKIVREVMERYGTYDLVTTKHQRFKADKTENRNHKATSTIEQVHILEKK